MNMFSKIPNNCLNCGETFDKTNKEMVQKWRVIVNNEPASVKLYCPDCWEQAQATLEYVNKQQKVEEKTEQDKPQDDYATWAYNLNKTREK